MDTKYVCKKPPCIHVVVDWRRKIYAVFLEDAEGEVIQLPSSEVKKACEYIKDIQTKKLEEARNDDVDLLAEKYLEAYPYTED